MIELGTRMEGEKRKRKKKKREKEFEATRDERKFEARSSSVQKKHAMRQFVSGLRNCGSASKPIFTPFLSLLLCNCFLALIKYYLSL